MMKSVCTSSMFLALVWLLLFQLKSTRAGHGVDGSGEKTSKHVRTKPLLCDNEDMECDPMVTTSTTAAGMAPNHFTIGQPLFRGDSYMVLPKLSSSARRSFELSLTFKAKSEEGLLLYSGGRASEWKDFFALGLRKGKLVLRFSNGDDTAILKTTENITLGAWHKVVVFRDLWHGYLTLDYGQLIRGSTSQKQKQMDLNTPLYLGGLPSAWLPLENIPYSHGFKGCIKSFVVDGEKIDLRFPGGDMIKSHKIDECSNSLQECKCQGQASCHFSNKGEPVCACPLGTAGQYCEREISLQIPSFSSNSYVTYPSLGDVASKSFTIRLVLKPKSDTGLIMLNADLTSGQGDFFSLSLREGNVEFLFDCGSGPAMIRSEKTIIVDHWHTITIWRNGAEGSLTLDDGLPVFGKSKGRLHHLSLRQNLFLGGMKDYKQQPYEVDMKSGFSGCIQKITINLVELDLTSPLSGINVDNCDHACVTQSICLNGGICHAEMENFQCECSVGYTGMFCNKGLKIKLPSFTGRSYLSYPSLGKESKKSFTIRLVLKPKKRSGLILYNGQYNGKGDFVSLSLREGKAEFMFNCGSGAALIRSKFPVSVNKWHTITVSRAGNNGKLVVDDELPVLGKSPGAFRHISFNDDLYIGGMKDYKKQPLAVGMTTGFVGCIQKITVNSKACVLSSPLSGVNVHNCDHVCVTHSMCLNNGICHATMDGFRCQCAVGYTGMFCEKAVSTHSHWFNGQSFAIIAKKKFTKRISGFSTNIRMDIKTLTGNGMIFFVHQPKIVNSSYILVGLIDGFLQVRIKRENFQAITIKSGTRVDDGSWHKVLIQRTLSTLVLKIDDSAAQKKLIERFFLRFNPGAILVGGLTTHVIMIKRSDWPSFQGSIRGFVIGGKMVDIKNELSIDIKARRYRTYDDRENTP